MTKRKTAFRQSLQRYVSAASITIFLAVLMFAWGMTVFSEWLWPK